jgi:hypothetical protein
MTSLSQFLVLAFCVYVAWAFVRHAIRDLRRRLELPARINAQSLRCPLCGGQLPIWGGAFETCPDEPIHTAWGFDGSPEGSFGLYCDHCRCKVWFSAWLDGTVRPHLGWMWKLKYKYMHLSQDLS